MTTAQTQPLTALWDAGSRFAPGPEINPPAHPWHRPLYFWLGMAPFAAVALVLYLMGSTLGAGVCVGIFLALATFVAPQVGVYTAFAVQAWDPYFVDPSRVLPVLGTPTPTKVLSFVLLAAYVVAPRRSKGRLSVTRASFALAAGVTAWGFLNSAFAPDSAIAARYAAQIAVLVIVILTTVRFVRTREQINRLMFWTIVGSITACVAFDLLGDPSTGQRGRLGEFSNPNTTAMTLAVGMMAVPAAWGLTRRKWMWGLYAPAAAYIMITLMKTGSRAACISVVAAYALGPAMTRGRGMVKKLLAAVFASVLGIGVFFAVLNARILDEKSQARLEALVHGSGTFAAGESRWDIWSNGLKTFRANPLLGSGYGNAAMAMEETVPGAGRDVHSNYVAALVEGGMVGGILFLLLLLAAAVAAWRIPRANPGAPAMILVMYLGISSIAHTTYVTKMFWMPLGLILCLCELGARSNREGDGPARKATATPPVQ